MFISSKHCSTFLISWKLFLPHLSSYVRQKAITVSTSQSYFVLQHLIKLAQHTFQYYPKLHKTLLSSTCPRMLAQSTSHCYFVLPDLHKVLPSTTLYYKGLHKILPSITLYYKGRTKHAPAPLVLQNLHHVFPYTTCTTKLAHVFCKGKILRTEAFTQ